MFSPKERCLDFLIKLFKGKIMKAKNIASKLKSLWGKTEITDSSLEPRDSEKAEDEVSEVNQKAENEQSPERDKIEKVRDKIASQKQEMRDMIDNVIEQEERTIKNYLSPKFWREKSEVYRRLKRKEKEDLNVYQVLSNGARPTIEYYILTILSCIIATNGLIMDSTAVIIGAMIVAPLMTPILAFSLGVIWGDLKLIKTSLQSIIKGTLVAIAISAAIAYLVPLPEYSQEILSRTKPTLFDIIVAIASGMVGAYGYANKKISTTLVGIAIAVALMPPLCTIGIGLGTFNKSITIGAIILYAINLISISLAGAVVFWGMKIHPRLADKEGVTKRALYQIILSIIILTSIAIPLGIYMYEQYHMVSALKTSREIIETELPDSSIFSMKTKKIKSGYILYVTLTGNRRPEAEKIKGIESAILSRSNDIKKIKLHFIQSSVLIE
jgi:uncharacterized hydrophobic protein (TIGR00271 family)